MATTDDRDAAAQLAALKAAGCEGIYREKASGGRWDRPELQRLATGCFGIRGGIPQPDASHQ